MSESVVEQGIDAAIIVPRRDDGGRRDEIWNVVKAWYAFGHPEVDVVEGHHQDGPFNRSAAINDGIRRAGKRDVYVIVDSDSFVEDPQLEQAISLAHTTGQLVLAYDLFCYLDKPMSNRVMAGYSGNWWDGVSWTLDWSVSSVVVVPAPLWEQLGGADEGFIGWGGEDFALFHALDTFGGGSHRIPGPVWHLWHPGGKRAEGFDFMERMRLYADRQGDPAAMRELVDLLRSEALT